MGMGGTVGSGVGAAAGAALGGPVGMALGGAAGGIVGGLIDKAGESDPQVARADPAQVARLKEIQQTSKEISSGTDALTQQRVSQVTKAGETTKGQVAKFAGGSTGGTISAMLRAQRGTNQGINQAFTQSQQRIPFFQNLESQLGNRIAQRKLELDINTQDTARAESAGNNRQLIGAVAGGIGAGAGLLGGGGGQMPGGGGVDSLGQFQSPTSGIQGIGQAPVLGGGDVGTQFQQGISGGTGAGFGGVGAPQTGFQL